MSGIKKKTKEYTVTCKFVECPDAEERTRKICELILKANINRLQKAISINPESFEAHHNLGVLNDKLGFKDRAKDCYPKARELRKK